MTIKCDVTLGKRFTFNTQNFSSAQPLLTITAKDIDLEKIEEFHKILDIIIDGLYHKQMESDINTMAAIKKLGFKEYFENINEEEMDEEIKRNIRLIINLNN